MMLIHTLQALFQTYLWLPAQIKQFASNPDICVARHRALQYLKLIFPLKPTVSAILCARSAIRNFLHSADVNNFLRIIIFHQKNQRIRQIIHINKFTQWRTRSPQHYFTQDYSFSPDENAASNQESHATPAD